MFICYKCAVHFFSLNELIKHFKYSHFLSCSDTLQCKQNECDQLFSSFKAFKAHIQKVHKHVEADVASVSETDNDTPNTINIVESKSENIDQLTETAVQDSTTSLNVKESVIILQEKALHFSLNLYAEDNMTRKDVLSIQNQVTVLSSFIADTLGRCIDKSQRSETLEHDIASIVEVCKQPFIDISTEHRFFKCLRELELYQDPHRHELGNYVTETVSRGNPTLAAKSFSAYFLPLRFQLKKIFESPGILPLTLKNTEALLSKNTICNFINGESYANKMHRFAGKTVIPIFLYFDDYGINNPLGSHATSILAGYYSFPTVPQFLLSQLKYIFNFAFIKSNDYKQFGNEVSFYHIIEEFIFLETEGILINTPQLNMKVYFILSAVLGDNLGLNSIMGFTKSFNSTSFCRACKRTKSETKRDCIEITESLRNEINYNLDLGKNAFQETGLRENCVFNRIPSFHVLDNFVFDAMHDLFEGVCHYDVCNILLSLLQDKIISVDTLNSRKNLFQYGDTEIGYISTSHLDVNRLKSLKLKMSAKETWAFVHFLPLMLGDLVPEKNGPWKLLCLLIQIVDTILLPEFNANDIDMLRTLIKEHNNLYIKLYGDLKPKHHFLVHYPTLIGKCGPPKYLWSFRFEAKHQSSKMYSSNTSSRVNIPYTLSIKAGLKFAKLLTDFKLGFESEYNLEHKDLLNMQDLHFSQVGLTDSQKMQLRSANVTQCGIYRGKKYKTNLYLSAFENFEIKLFKIVYIVELSKNSLHILANAIEIKRFDYHFQSYEVGSYLDLIQLKPIEYFTSPPLHIYTSNNGKVYLRNKFL